MAFVKICDACSKELKGAKPFLHVFGSISEQKEDGTGEVFFRFLTPHNNYKLAVCDNQCLAALLDKWREGATFEKRPQRGYPHW